MQKHERVQGVQKVQHDCGAMKKGMSKTKMFLTQNKDDGNKVCMMGTKID
jgi:hypothetical protein